MGMGPLTVELGRRLNPSCLMVGVLGGVLCLTFLCIGENNCSVGIDDAANDWKALVLNRSWRSLVALQVVAEVFPQWINIMVLLLSLSRGLFIE